MPYQLSKPDPYSASAAATAYAVLLYANFDMVAGTCSFGVSIWRAKADKTGGAAPISTFSRTVSGASVNSLITSINTAMDNAVTGSQIFELAGASVVA